MKQNYSKNRKELIQEMEESQGFISCQHCNTSSSFKFHCHHIIFRSETRSEEVHNKRNLIIVCNNCHDEFHTHKSKRDYLVEQRMLKTLFGLR